MDGITIRAATKADAAAITRVHLAAWRGAYRGILPDSTLALFALPKKHWTERLSVRSPAVTFVSEQNAEIFGWATIGPSRDADLAEQNFWELYGMYLLPARWRLGAGTLLWRAAEQALRERAVRQVSLWVLETNQRARAFYEQLGFVADGAVQTITRLDIPLPQRRYRLAL